MAGKVLIGGTAYTITGGKTLVGGTAYSISGGKTLIGGTAYDIVFQQGQHTLVDMLRHTVVVNIAGCEVTTSQTISIPVTVDGTYYLFVFSSGYAAIYKVVRAGTITYTRIGGASSTQTGISVESDSSIKTFRTAYGATMALCQFSGYTPAEIDAFFTATTTTMQAGRNNKSKGSVSATAGSFSNKIMLVATNTDIGFSFVPTNSTTPEVLFGTNATNPSLVIYTSPSFVLSIDGSTAASVHGGSMLSME